MTTPVLPPEIWAIIMYYKEQIEYREDCIIGNPPKKLRSGRLIWNNDTRLERFMNETSNLIGNYSNRGCFTVKKLYELIKNYYYFIKTLKNKESKRRIEKLIRAIENKVEQLNHDLELFIVARFPEGFTRDNREYCICLVSRCRYFLNHYECIADTKTECHRHMMTDCNGIIVTCSDFVDWCK
jgi:hypothetical protein